MKATEIDEFEKKYGYKPTAIRGGDRRPGGLRQQGQPARAADHRSRSTPSSPRAAACGGKPVTTWGRPRPDRRLGGKPISLYGRNSASGTYGFFKEHALCKGDYKDTVKEQPGSASVVQGITEDQFAIGYSGIGYKTSGVKTLKLAQEARRVLRYRRPDRAVGQVPAVALPLHLHQRGAQQAARSPLVREFVKYVLSKEGQEVVVKDGFLPVSAKTAQEQAGKLK